MTKHELLKYALSKGIIDLSALETQVEDMERKINLEMDSVSRVDCFDE